jgi:hypothetical protein
VALPAIAAVVVQRYALGAARGSATGAGHAAGD